MVRASEKNWLRWLHLTAGRRSSLLPGLLFLFLPAACVMVPYTPSAESTRALYPIAAEKNFIVTIGPRKLLDSVSEALKKEASAIELVDRLEFRDRTWPDGGWTLHQLLEGRGPGGLPADSLVVVGSIHHVETKKRGGMTFYIGFYGLTKTDETAELSALVIDLRTMLPVTVVTTTTKGSDFGVGLFYGLFIIADMEKSVLRGLSRDIALVLKEIGAGKPLRVAVMAAESQETTSFLTRGRAAPD
jgi:hypothetical protein